MGELAFKRAPEFVISTGDNFYQRACIRIHGLCAGHEVVDVPSGLVSVTGMLDDTGSVKTHGCRHSHSRGRLCARPLSIDGCLAAVLVCGADGLSSTFDDNFRISYMDVYNAKSLAGIPWHAVRVHDFDVCSVVPTLVHTTRLHFHRFVGLTTCLCSPREHCWMPAYAHRAGLLCSACGPQGCFSGHM